MMGDEGLCKSAVQAGNEWTWVGKSRGGSSVSSGKAGFANVTN